MSKLLGEWFADVAPRAYILRVESLFGVVEGGPAPRGTVKVEVTFEIDTDGIVNVSARDVETGVKASTSITLSGGMSEEEIAAAASRNASTELRQGGPGGG